LNKAIPADDLRFLELFLRAQRWESFTGGRGGVIIWEARKT